MKEARQVLFSAGDCPVCSSSGILALLVSVADESAVFACPLCGVAWKTPPPPHTVDEIVAIEEAAPQGLRFPTVEEIHAVRSKGVHLLEVELVDWADDLTQYLVKSR